MTKNLDDIAADNDKILQRLSELATQMSDPRGTYHGVIKTNVRALIRGQQRLLLQLAVALPVMATGLAAVVCSIVLIAPHLGSARELSVGDTVYVVILLISGCVLALIPVRLLHKHTDES